jgi:hypothetical protein
MPIERFAEENYIYGMATTSGGLINILESAMNACCKQHDFCCGCKRIESCINIWKNAFEKSFENPMTSQELTEYIQEFNLLWESPKISNTQNNLEITGIT